MAPHVACDVDAALRCLCLAVFGVFAPLTWGVLALLPRYAWRQAVVRVLARLALRLAGIPWSCMGKSTSHSTVPTCSW